MKNFIKSLFLAAVFLQGATVSAACITSCEPAPVSGCCEDWHEFDSLNFVARYSAFFPLSDRVTHIYDHALPCLELEANVNVCDNLLGFFSAGYIWDNGASVLGNRTELSLVPLTLGAKYLLCWSDCVDLYVGTGLVYSFLSTHDHSDFVKQHRHKGAFGGAAKTGFYYYFSDCLFFEGFLDYLYQRYSFSDYLHDGGFVEGANVNMSGIKLGFGVGLYF